MDRTLDSFLDLDEHAELGDSGNLTLLAGTIWMSLSDRYPWIIRKLLDTEAQAFIWNIDDDRSELPEGEIVFVVDVVSGFSRAEVLKAGEESRCNLG